MERLAPSPMVIAITSQRWVNYRVTKLGPFSSLGQNLINNHLGPNCKFVAAATCDSSTQEMKLWEEVKAAPRSGEGMKACLPGTQPGPAALSMAPCQCHYVGVHSGAVSAQTDVTHFQTLVRRPPTPDTVRAPGPDAVRRQVLDKRQIRALLPHVSHNRVSPPLPPRLDMGSQSFPFQIGRV